MPIDQLDRSTIVDAGRRLYPKCLQSERAELVHDPLEEIVGFGRTIVRQAPTLRWDEYRYWTERKAEIDAKLEADRKFLAELTIKLGTYDWRNDPDAVEQDRRYWAQLHEFDPPKLGGNIKA